MVHDVAIARSVNLHFAIYQEFSTKMTSVSHACCKFKMHSYALASVTRRLTG